MSANLQLVEALRPIAARHHRTVAEIATAIEVSGAGSGPARHA
ncbi:hypothetical protein [Nocardia acidivorans]|nr:hypothetical protein [Nocardia acidivorans]